MSLLVLVEISDRAFKSLHFHLNVLMLVFLIVTNILELVSENLVFFTLLLSICSTVSRSTAVCEQVQVLKIFSLFINSCVERRQLEEKLSFVLAQEGVLRRVDPIISSGNNRDQEVESHNVKKCCENEEHNPLESSLFFCIWIFT